MDGFEALGTNGLWLPERVLVENPGRECESIAGKQPLCLPKVADCLHGRNAIRPYCNSPLRTKLATEANSFDELKGWSECRRGRSLC